MTNTQAEPHSFEVCSEAELFPKKSTVCDDDGLPMPFPALRGESVEYLGRVTDGVIALSNYRLLVRAKKWFVNIPLGLIDGVETREIFYILISCKDATTVRLSFPTNDWCQVWYKRLVEKTIPMKDLNQCFALCYHAWCMDDNASGSQSSASVNSHSLCQITDDVIPYKFGNEVKRMKFDTSMNKVWRMSYINENFGVCPSYPNIHIVPACITDEHLTSVAGFRSMRRFPSVVWRSQRNGAVIVRCSQPELGWLGWRNTEDENLLTAIPQACSQDAGTDSKTESGQTSPDTNGAVALPSVNQKKMLLIDCRSYGAAFANRAKGGGCESADYYPCCEIQFMNLANIHSIRKSFLALRVLSSVTEQANWLSSLETTKWLHYIGAIIRAANLVVSAVDKEARPVLVHCSDGWDRTPQIVALAELLLDPYYRKIEGFQVLVEREWFEFGHKFADRCGHSLESEDANERSPVFLQWLDCVYQVYKQFPCAFEFNEAYLIKLVHHTYSRLFGNFLFNTAQERIRENLSKRTTSIWTLLHPKNTKFLNLLYNESAEQQVLYPEFCMNNLSLWRSVYMSNSSLSTHTTDDFTSILESGEVTPEIELEVNNLPKTRSCENLAKLQDHAPLVTRRLSDPNILHGSQEQIMAACKDLDSSPKHTEGDEGVLDDNDDSIVGVLTKCVNTNGCNGVSSEDSDKDSDSEENTVTVSDSNDNIVNHTGKSDDEGLVKDEQEDEKEGEEEEEDEDSDERTIVSNGVCNGHSEPQLTNGHSDHQLTNGQATANEIQAKKLVNGHHESNTSDRKHPQKSIESSTDTLIGDEFFEKKGEENSILNGITNHFSNGLTNGVSNGHVNEEDLVNIEDNHQYLINKNSIRPISSMSTSTSDISDSRVAPHKRDWDSKITDLKLVNQCYNCPTGFNRPSFNSASPSPSSSSPYPTPFCSRTPNSTCPPTPETQSKLYDWQINRQLNGVGRHLDCDGLTTFVDPIQQRMQQKEAEYQRKIEELKQKIDMLQKCCYSNGIQRIDTRDEALCLQEDPDGDHCSLISNVSNPASDVSWETVDTKDSQMILWIPDHAVTHCACCESKFWTANRKHHCRSCGKIYCSDCSNYFSPVPQQMLKEPVRVCQSCHLFLQHQTSEKDLVESKNTPQMVLE